MSSQTDKGLDTMNIGLITIHYANSYGGVLQAYATQKILSNYGEVEIINYQKTHLANGLRTIRYGKNASDLLRIGKDILRYRPRKKLVLRFKSFISKHLLCSEPVLTREELSSISEKYDALIVGSDQVWNPKIIGGLDTNYLLEFSKKDCKFSLSSSYGSYKFTKEEKEVLQNCLNKFSSISVREDSSSQELHELLKNSKITTTLDPTLLLAANDWSQITNISRTSPPYILVYLLGSDELLGNAVKIIKNSLNLKVVTINQDPFLNFKSDEHIRDAGPSEFISYFKDASFVITNSFHGTAFSINFNKQFITLPPQSSANRIVDLLSKLELEHRYLNSTSELAKTAKTEINYANANKALEKLRTESKEYINDAITKCKIH